MTAHQMICHLTDSFEVMEGTRHASPASGPLQRTFVKWVALRTNFPWPRGVPTRPEIEQGKGGTPPSDWARDLARLHRAMDHFVELRTFAPHPIFGPLTRAETMIWGFRHVDHHLRQFGI